jgi:hypothetical protein
MGRRIIIASYLYYNRNSPIVSDAVFDESCKLVAYAWDFLSPIRKWQLGSEQELLAGGSHIKVTRIGEAAAIAMHIKKFNRPPHGPNIPPGWWKRSEKFRCEYATLNG